MTKMKFREHRGSLDDSMATCVELDPTYDALKEHLKAILAYWPLPEHLELLIKPYGYDDRIQWTSFIVYMEGWGVVGFTNQMPTSLPQES